MTNHKSIEWIWDNTGISRSDVETVIAMLAIWIHQELKAGRTAYLPNVGKFHTRKTTATVIVSGWPPNCVRERRTYTAPVFKASRVLKSRLKDL